MLGFETGKIDPSAIISKEANIGDGVTIGAHAIIYDHVSIGDHSIIGANCIIGEPTADYYRRPDYVNKRITIGANALIRSGAILYAGSVIGADFECGHRVTIREGSMIGEHCRVGTLSDIQGDCRIGDYARLHSNVHIGQKSRIGNFVWIFPYTVLTNDPYPPSNDLFGVTIKDFAVIATHVTILPGVVIGRDALIGAGSVVRADVAPETVAAGNPAKPIATIHEIENKRSKGEKMYPWREHFERGMPWEGMGYLKWKETAAKIDQTDDLE